MFKLPAEAHTIRLCKVVRNELILCEPVIFHGGAPAVDTILRRAALGGKVGPLGETGDYWADLMDADADNLVETIALDRGSWNAIKNKWARCKIWAPLRERARAIGLRG
ncbi:hypothetical protein [Pseudorhodoplanes sp.]|uniref:hypothetical protein n=1 Tax=Pseudorhodoplanes sp. TaxID=1934341 RepID=UPI003D0EAAA1